MRDLFEKVFNEEPYKWELLKGMFDEIQALYRWFNEPSRPKDLAYQERIMDHLEDDLYYAKRDFVTYTVQIIAELEDEDGFAYLSDNELEDLEYQIFSGGWGCDLIKDYPFDTYITECEYFANCILEQKEKENES